VATFWKKVRGTSETLFQHGLGGPHIKNNGGVLEHRNATDTAFVIARGLDPVGADDFATKRYVDQFVQRLNANATTTVVTATATNLSFAMAANEAWEVEAQLTAQCSGVGGSKFAIGTPAGATIEGWIRSSLGTITTLSYQRIVAVNALNATALHTVATTPGPDVIKFAIVNGAVAGNCVLQIASVTATQTTTLFLGSYWKARRVVSV
jgi:hypothetical protein